jgi:Protein of unknown function (DUF3349)
MRYSSIVHLPVRERWSAPSTRRRTTIDPLWEPRQPNRPWGADTVTKFLAKIVAWITAGYPEGVPGPDRVPLFALLKPRLTDDEVKSVAKELDSRGEFDEVDIGVLITQLTDELPDPADVERVRNRLAGKGWPLDDPRDSEETE